MSLPTITEVDRRKDCIIGLMFNKPLDSIYVMRYRLKNIDTSSFVPYQLVYEPNPSADILTTLFRSVMGDDKNPFWYRVATLLSENKRQYVYAVQDPEDNMSYYSEDMEATVVPISRLSQHGCSDMFVSLVYMARAALKDTAVVPPTIGLCSKGWLDTEPVAT